MKGKFLLSVEGSSYLNLTIDEVNKIVFVLDDLKIDYEVYSFVRKQCFKEGKRK